MSSSSTPETYAVPVSLLPYRDIANPYGQEAEAVREDHGDSQESHRAEIELSQAEFSARIRQEREQAAREVEARFQREYQEKLMIAQSSVTGALEKFSEQRSDYFSRVEAEVVQLSLAIAAKILHRESQIDPMLLAALVRVAIERMKDTTSVVERVSASRVAVWKTYFSELPELANVEVLGDDKLNEHDCVLETEVGSTNFALDKQLKEVEQGFFDLLALRPSKS